jgi:uncharacterized protein
MNGNKGKIYYHICRTGFIICLVCLCIFSAYAQKEPNPNGYNVFYFPNGKISSEGNMKGGKPDGYWKSYYENGQLKSEGNRLNFKLDSTWKFYNDKGVLTSQLNYKEGIRHGIQRTFYETTGQVQSEEIDSMGIKSGLAKFYREDGSLEKTIPYVNGVEHGMAREFAEDGRLILATTYRNGYFQKEEKINRIDKLGMKQGIWKEFYENDQPKSEGNYKDDKRDGIFKQYSMDGRVINKEEWRNGELLIAQKKEEEKFEVKRQYYQTGATKIVGTYKKGVPEGVFRQYDEKGNLEGTKVYHAGKMLREGIMDEQGREQGQWKEYYESGHLRSIGNYVDGRREGEWKFSFENDSMEQVGTYEKGKPNGPWKWYYPNGTLRREETYSSGKENGNMKEYDQEGSVIAEGNYVEGKQDGPWKFSNGEYVAEGNFVDGKEDGVWKQFYRDGKIAFEGEYVEGQESGEHKYYYPNGRLSESRNYRLGVADKLWKKFDPGGAPVLQVTYQNGDEKKWDETPVPEGDFSE